MKVSIYIPDPSALSPRYFDANEDIEGYESSAQPKGLRLKLEGGIVKLTFVDVAVAKPEFLAFVDNYVLPEHREYALARLAHARTVLECTIEGKSKGFADEARAFLFSLTMDLCGMAQVDSDLFDFTGGWLTDSE